MKYFVSFLQMYHLFLNRLFLNIEHGNVSLRIPGPLKKFMNLVETLHNVYTEIAICMRMGRQTDEDAPLLL